MITKKYKKYEDMTRDDFQEYIRDMNQAIDHLAEDIKEMEADMLIIQAHTKDVSAKLNKALDRGAK